MAHNTFGCNCVRNSFDKKRKFVSRYICAGEGAVRYSRYVPFVFKIRHRSYWQKGWNRLRGRWPVTPTKKTFPRLFSAGMR